MDTIHLNNQTKYNSDIESLRSRQSLITRMSRNFPLGMEHEHFLSCSQQPTLR